VVVKVEEEMKNAKSNTINKTSVVEDKVKVNEVKVEEFGQVAQELSASNVGSTVICQGLQLG